MNHSPIRIGVLGCGFGRLHLEHLLKMPEFQVTAVAELEPKRLDNIPELAEGNIPVYSDYRELLDRGNLDAVLLTLPTFLHASVTLECLDRGLNVLCEKPPTCNYSEMLAVEAKVRATGLTYMFGRQGRFSPHVLESRAWISQGRLGKIHGAQAEWVRVRGSQLSSGSWRSDLERGGGVLLDLGIHGIDSIWFAMDCPEFVEVSASNVAGFRSQVNLPEGYTADDATVGWIRFANGAVLQFRFAFGMNVDGPWIAGEDGKPKQANEWNTCQIYGEKAGLDVYRGIATAGPLHAATSEALQVDTTVSAMQRQLEEFARAIRTGTEPINSVSHALQLMEMLTLLRASSELGRSLLVHPGRTLDIVAVPPTPLEAMPEDYRTSPSLPDSGYRVHDFTRPQPPIVQAPVDAPPSDAVVLFDGKDLASWTQLSDGSPAQWKLGDGWFEVVPKSGNIRTNAEFGDVQLHVEFASPAEVVSQGQGRGNSGIFLMGLYEVQVLDNYQNPTYADGTVGAMYGQWPPLANAIRPPGEWNVYEIIWEGPKFLHGVVIQPARITVMLNGVLLHHARPLHGPTEHKRLASYGGNHPLSGPLVLQDHNDRVRYRNIWLRPL